jgi:hypothetical protein
MPLFFRNKGFAQRYFVISSFFFIDNASLMRFGGFSDNSPIIGDIIS